MANLPSNLGGAYDLSALANARRQAPATDATAATTGAETAQGEQTGGQLQVANLVMDVAPAGLAKFVKLSEKVPILIEFHTLRSEGSVALSPKLAAEVGKRSGELILLRIDGDSAGQLLQAFQVTGLPAVCALLMGQPVPLFNGDQDAETLSVVLDKLLQLARENGVTQRAVVSEDAAPPAEPELPPHHKAAYAAIEAGDYALAVTEFEAALNDAPADVVAATGLAQAKLLVRTKGLNLEEVLAKPAQTLSDVIQKSDVLAMVGHFEKAFSAILDAFEVATKEDRDTLRQQLLELFKVAGPGAPEIAAARVRLTNLLY